MFTSCAHPLWAVPPASRKVRENQTSSGLYTSGRTSEEVHYVALSRRLTTAKVLEIKRANWSIENHLHWTLDVLFDEDDARTRKNYAPENLAVIRRLAQNILRAHPLDGSMSLKMFRAMISEEFFFELFAYMR